MANAKEWVDQSVQFFREVWIELKKVHWPTRKETYAATLVVVIITLIVAVFLGVADYAVSHMVRAVLS